VQPCFWRRKIVFDPADVMKARNTSSSTSPQQASLCFLTTPPSLPPFWKRGSTERKRFKTGPKKKWKHWTLTAALQICFWVQGLYPAFWKWIFENKQFLSILWWAEFPRKEKDLATKMNWTFHKFILLCWGRETALLKKRFPSRKCDFT